jgi:hypothetical protein
MPLAFLVDYCQELFNLFRVSEIPHAALVCHPVMLIDPFIRGEGFPHLRHWNPKVF